MGQRRIARDRQAAVQGQPDLRFLRALEIQLAGARGLDRGLAGLGIFVLTQQAAGGGHVALKDHLAAGDFDGGRGAAVAAAARGVDCALEGQHTVRDFDGRGGGQLCAPGILTVQRRIVCDGQAAAGHGQCRLARAAGQRVTGHNQRDGVAGFYPLAVIVQIFAERDVFTRHDVLSQRDRAAVCGHFKSGLQGIVQGVRILSTAGKRHALKAALAAFTIFAIGVVGFHRITGSVVAVLAHGSMALAVIRPRGHDRTRFRVAKQVAAGAYLTMLLVTN